MKTKTSWTRFRVLAMLLMALTVLPALGSFTSADAKPGHDRSNSRWDRRWDDNHRRKDDKRWHDNRRWDNRNWSKKRYSPKRRYHVRYRTVWRNGRAYRQYYRVYY